MAVKPEGDSTDGTIAELNRPAAFRTGIIGAIRIAGWSAGLLALVGFTGAIVGIVDLASHFRVAYAVAMIPALITYLVCTF